MIPSSEWVQWKSISFRMIEVLIREFFFFVWQNFDWFNAPEKPQKKKKGKTVDTIY